MPYYAKQLLCTQHYTVQQDHILFNCPKDLQKQWLAEGLIELRGAEERPLIDLPFSDVLSDLDQAGLKEVIIKNNLATRPTTAWPLEMIRQAIRNEVLDVSELEMPDASGTPTGHATEPGK